MIRRRVLVRGLVQGVGFRAGVERRARSQGVSGWVRNLPDGSLEAVFEGDRQAVASLVEFCRLGRPGAAVHEVHTTDEPPTGETGFGLPW